MNNEVYAAIALALHEHLGNNVHDAEPGIITISAHPTQWNGYAQTFTQHPGKYLYTFKKNVFLKYIKDDS